MYVLQVKKEGNVSFEKKLTSSLALLYKINLFKDIFYTHICDIVGSSLFPIVFS